MTRRMTAYIESDGVQSEGESGPIRAKERDKQPGSKFCEKYSVIAIRKWVKCDNYRLTYNLL